MWVYSDEVFLEHDTGRDHPERPERLRRVITHLRETGLWEQLESAPIVSATVEQLTRVHDEQYVQQVARLAEQGGGWLETDTPLSRRSYDVARQAAGTACDAVKRVLEADTKSEPGARQALCIIRPPGHHALPSRGMGFCLFNSVAVAACEALETFGLRRVLIVDFDVHHGNGTQDIFWQREEVGFFSIHRYPFYPGTGDESETGTGAGLGMTRNLPMTFGVSRDEYHAKFEQQLNDFAAHVQPELILLSAGFDAHRLDPVGSLGLDDEDFARLTDTLLDLADEYAGGRVVSLLEGGYNVDVLGSSVASHIQQLLAR